MRVLVLSRRDVEELFPMQTAIGVMEDALAALARGECHQPLRSLVRAGGASGFLGLMPAYRSGPKSYYGLKEVCVFPGNPARGLDTHLGAVLLHSGETGELLAVANASAITAIRTAAVSAVATKLLAREDAETLAVIGTGVQARSHIESMRLARPLRDIRVAGRTEARARAFVESLPMRAGVRTVATAEEAALGADLIVTATSSREPVLRREWIAEGTHINAVGSSVASTRELDGATLAAAKLFADRRESLINESGDYLFALREGSIAEGHPVSEIGEVLTGSRLGRETLTEITLFKSLGLAIEDLAAAAYLYELAQKSERGSWVEF